MITMHARPFQTDGQTGEHHGNSVTQFVLTKASRAKKFSVGPNYINAMQSPYFTVTVIVIVELGNN